jgi:hypothetical protein
MKRKKKNHQMPADYQLLLHLSDIQHWKKLPRTIAETEIRYTGYYLCVYENKRTLVIE